MTMARFSVIWRNGVHVQVNIVHDGKWKNMLNKAVNDHIEAKWHDDLKEKSSLKYINQNSLKVGKTHPVWSSLFDNKRAQLKLAHTHFKAIELHSINTQLTLHVNCV